MTLRVSLDIAKKVSICTPAFDEIVKYYTDNGIETATVEEMIAHWKSMGRRDWALWLYAHVPEFERLVGEEATAQEKAAFATDEAYLKAIDVVGYTVNNVEYSTLEAAEAARQAQLDVLKVQTEPLCVCNLEIIADNGDSTWLPVDLDDFVAPEGKPYKIQVFNPAIGRYSDHDSLASALEQRNANMVQVADIQFASAVIYPIKKHVDFLHEEPSASI